MTDLTSLIERLEKSTAPGREHDAQIWLAMTPGTTRRATEVKSSTNQWPPYTIDETRDETGRLITVPAYTSSIDTAVSLAELVLPGCFYIASKGKTRHDEPLYAAQILFGTDQVLGEAESDASLAVAIVTATLRALQSRGEA